MQIFAENKKAFFDYEILEKFNAGLALKGGETKAIKNKRVSLVGGRVIIRAGEAFLVGVEIQLYQPNNQVSGVEANRTIKLLLNKKEISYLTGKIHERGLTLLPLKLYNVRQHVKVEIALAKGKKKFDKREAIKKRESQIKIGRILKEDRE